MVTFDELTPEQKNILTAFVRNFRGWVNSHIGRALVEARALDAAYDATNGAAAILATLNPGEKVVDGSGIAGVHVLTKEEIEAFATAGLQDFLTAYDTEAVRRLVAKIAGPTAGL